MERLETMSEKGFDDHDECTIEEEEQERLMLVELPPKKSEQEKIIYGVDADTGGQTSVFLHLRSALCLLWTIVQFLMALVGVYHLSSLNILIRSGGHESVDDHVDKKHNTLSIINHNNYEYCHSNNIVMSRGDGYGHDPGQDKRTYSISPQTFQALDSSHDTICDSVNDTMHAIAAGGRHWINVTHENLSSLEKEKLPSYFVPATCNLPAFTAPQLCDIMDEYSYVITIGDSLTRHLRQAFFMAMLDNLIDGGMVIPDGSVNQDQFYSCRCDGQFSENLSCRSLGGLFGNLVNPREYHVCSHLPIDTDRFQFSQGWNDAVFETLCKQGDIASNNENGFARAFGGDGGMCECQVK